MYIISRKVPEGCSVVDIAQAEWIIPFSISSTWNKGTGEQEFVVWCRVQGLQHQDQIKRASSGIMVVFGECGDRPEFDMRSYQHVFSDGAAHLFLEKNR